MDARTYAKAAQRLRDKWGDKAGLALEALAEFDAGEYTVEDVAIQIEESRIMLDNLTARKRAVVAVGVAEGKTHTQLAKELRVTRGATSTL